MCQVSTTRVISNNIAVVLNNKPIIPTPPAKMEEFGSYGDYWGYDELPLPIKKNKPVLASRSSSTSLKSEESCVSYGSYWGLDQE